MWNAEFQLNNLYRASGKKRMRGEPDAAFFIKKNQKTKNKPTHIEVAITGKKSYMIDTEYCHPDANFYSDTLPSALMIIGYSKVDNIFFVDAKHLQKIECSESLQAQVYDGNYVSFDRIILFTLKEEVYLTAVGVDESKQRELFMAEINGGKPFEYVLQASNCTVKLKSNRNVKNDGIHMKKLLEKTNEKKENLQKKLQKKGIEIDVVKEVKKVIDNLKIKKSYEELEIYQLKINCPTFKNIDLMSELKTTTNAHIDTEKAILLNKNKVLLLCSGDPGKGHGEILLIAAYEYLQQNYTEVVLDALPTSFTFFERQGFSGKKWET